MQSILNLNGHYGLPLCVSGITHRLSLPKEMADHERRRKAMKRQRSSHQAREGRPFHGNQEMGILQRIHEEMIKEEEGVVAPNHDFSHTCFACTAKAA